MEIKGDTPESKCHDWGQGSKKGVHYAQSTPIMPLRTYCFFCKMAKGYKNTRLGLDKEVRVTKHMF